MTSDTTIKIRRKSPVFFAREIGKDVKASVEGVPGVHFDEASKHWFVLTVHRARHHLRTGMFLVWDDDERHHRPMANREELDRHFDQV